MKMIAKSKKKVGKIENSEEMRAADVALGRAGQAAGSRNIDSK